MDGRRVTAWRIPEGDCEVLREGGKVLWRKRGEERYLEIEPQTIWVHPDLSIDNSVISNTEWIVE